MVFNQLMFSCSQIFCLSYQRCFKGVLCFLLTFFIANHTSQANDSRDSLLAIFSNQDNEIVKKSNQFIDEVVDEFRLKELGKKKLPKQVKELYRLVHESKFHKYDIEAQFTDVFKNGHYNCVTASALYAFVLSELSINYEIRETVDHVYIIINPESDNLYLESTDPSQGVYTFTEQFQKRYVDFLVSEKLVTEQEVSSRSVSEIFNEQFYEDAKVISLKQLAALQYYNKALELQTKEEVRESLMFSKKALSLYPCDRIEFLHAMGLENLLNTSEIYSTDGAMYLVEYFGLSREIGKKEITERFKHVLNHLLFTKQAMEDYEAFYSIISQGILDPVYSNLITQMDLEGRGRYYLMTNDFEKAFSAALMGYQSDTVNLVFQEVALSAFGNIVQSQESKKSALDTLLSYGESLPFLRVRQAYKNNVIHYCATIVHEELRKDNYQESNRYLEKLEREIQSFELNFGEKDIVAKTYVDVASYYRLKLRKYQVSYNYLNRGLKIVPENFYLLEAKKYMVEGGFLDD